MAKSLRDLSSILLVCMAGCQSTSPPPIAGQVLHGRYLDPAGQFSIRVPLLWRKHGRIVDQVDGRSGRLVFGSSPGASSLAAYLLATSGWSSAGGSLHWCTPSDPAELALLQDADSLGKFEKLRTHTTNQLRDVHEAAEIVHQEYLPWLGGQADFFAVWIPRGGSRRELPIHSFFFHFVRGETSYLLGSSRLVKNEASMQAPEDGIHWIDEARARLADLAGRICFDDPLLAAD